MALKKGLLIALSAIRRPDGKMPIRSRQLENLGLDPSSGFRYAPQDKSQETWGTGPPPVQLTITHLTRRRIVTARHMAGCVGFVQLDCGQRALALD
jgi:hypothetical protein